MAGDKIKFGATVTIVDEDTDEEIRYQLVGDFESDASNGRISISSPVARALMGKEVGDSAEVATPGGGRFFRSIESRIYLVEIKECNENGCIGSFSYAAVFYSDYLGRLAKKTIIFSF